MKLAYKESYTERENSFNIDVSFALKISEVEIFYEILRKEKNLLEKIRSRTKKFEFYEHFVDMMIEYFDDCLNFEKTNIFGIKRELVKNVYEDFLCSCYNSFGIFRKYKMYHRAFEMCKVFENRNTTDLKNIFSNRENFFEQLVKIPKNSVTFSMRNFTTENFGNFSISSLAETIEIISVILTYWNFHEKSSCKFESSKKISAMEFHDQVESLFNAIFRKYLEIRKYLNFSRKAFRKLFFVVDSSCFEIFSKRTNWKKFVENFPKFVENSKKLSSLLLKQYFEIDNRSFFAAEKSKIRKIPRLRKWMVISSESMIDFSSFFFSLSRFFLENFLFGHIREVLSYMTETKHSFQVNFSTCKRRHFSNFFDRQRKIVELSRLSMKKDQEQRNFFFSKRKRFFLNCTELKISMKWNNFHDFENSEEAFRKRKNTVEEFVRNFLRKFSIYDENSIRSECFLLLPKNFLKNHFSKNFFSLRIRPVIGTELFAKKYRYRVNIPKSSKMNLDVVKTLLLKSNFEIVENLHSRTLFFNSENEDDMVTVFLASFDRKKFSGKLTIHKKILLNEIQKE